MSGAIRDGGGVSDASGGLSDPGPSADGPARGTRRLSAGAVPPGGASDSAGGAAAEGSGLAPEASGCPGGAAAQVAGGSSGPGREVAGRSGGDSGRRTLPSRRRLALHPPLRAALRHGLGDVWRVCAVEALVLVAAVAEVLATRIALPGLMLPGALLAAGVLPLRRRFPRAVMLVALPTLATGVLWLPAMAALHAVAVSRRRREVVVAAAAVAVVSFVPWRGLGDYPWTLPDVTLGLLLSGLLAVAPAALGRLARARRELAARLGELALSRDRERRYAAEQAALRERERLARDVHDTAAHHLSLISLRSATLAATAESAEYRAQAEALGDLSRRAAADLSETVRRAGPGLARLPQLLQAAGAVAVRLDLGACPQDVERTAYRVVQEGLTNARRHAPGARVEVDVHRAAGALRLSVRNGPAPLPAPTPEPGGGHGLPGLRARTTALGGTFTAFPTPDGGFAVEATVPLGAAG